MAKRVIFATEGIDQHVWAAFVRALEEHNGHRHAITQVSMDMSARYERGVRDNCRNAQMVYDKFHVIAHANKAVEQSAACRNPAGRHRGMGTTQEKQMALAQEP